VVGFDGRSRSTLASPAARLPIGQGGELGWQGLSGEVEASRDGRSIGYRLKSAGLTVSDPAKQGAVRFGALAFQGDGQALSAGGPLMVGKVQGTLDTMEVAGGSGAEAVKVVFSGLSFSSATRLDGELLGGTSSFAATGSVGDVKLDKVEMTMSMKRLHAPTYQRLMETVTKEVYRCDAAGQAAALAGLQGKVQDDLMAILRHGPEISVDRFAVQSGGLTGELSYAVGLEGVTEADAQLPMPALLMTRAQARAAARLPVAWLRQLSHAGASRIQGAVPDPATVDVMLEHAQKQGYVVRDGDYVKGEVSFAKGAVTVNGKALAVK
jgi:uncharacterized protein YdgA (DUF945 family)